MHVCRPFWFSFRDIKTYVYILGLVWFTMCVYCIHFPRLFWWGLMWKLCLYRSTTKAIVLGFRLIFVFGKGYMHPQLKPVVILYSNQAI